MNIMGLLQLILEGICSDGSRGRKLLIHFHNLEQYERCAQALLTFQNEKLEPKHIRMIPLIHTWVCPIKAGFDLHSLLDYNEITIEEDACLSTNALSKKPVAWRRGLPWGVRHIKAHQAWNTTMGYRVHIGVIDTGVDFHHPDLRYSLMRGINLVHPGSPPYDDNGHGTHIAGTIAAASQRYGMTGVAPRSLVHPVKAFDRNGAAYISDIIQGIDWCVHHRMNIINMSFGTRTRSKSLLKAVMNAYNAGVIIVASSGNDANRNSIDYPARYLHTISVGATDRVHKIAPFSNQGRYVDIYAPGDKIMSAWLKGKYHEMSGTSMATSHVSGAIALLLAMRPGLEPAKIKSLLRRSANPTRDRFSTSRGNGEIDVMQLLKEAKRT